MSSSDITPSPSDQCDALTKRSDPDFLQNLFAELKLTKEQESEIDKVQNSKFPDSSEWALGPDGEVLGGSFPQLLLYLTQPDAQNMEFQDEFLRTFPSFAPPVLVLASLFARFFVDPGDCSSAISTHNLVQDRVVSIIRRWIRIGLYQFNPDMISAIEMFSTFTSENPSYKKYRAILGSSLNELRGHQRSYTVTEQVAPPLILPPGDPQAWTILSMKPIELVRQITLHHFSMFQSITCFELLTGIWGEKKGGGCPHLNLMIDYFNDFSNFIQQSILNEAGLNKRASVYLYWMDVASKFYIVSNFHGIFCVIAALTHPCIQRLSQTIEISQQLMGTMEVSFEFLEHLCEISNDFYAYRSIIKDAPRPTIPYIGCLQKDLIYTQEAFPNHFMGTDLINFEKCKKCVELVKAVESYQNQRYPFTPHERLQELISHLPPQKSLIELMKQSQSIEKTNKKPADKGKKPRKSRGK